MAERQQKEISDLKMAHAEQAGKAQAKHSSELEELRRSLEQEKEDALIKERQLASTRYTSRLYYYTSRLYCFIKKGTVVQTGNTGSPGNPLTDLRLSDPPSSLADQGDNNRVTWVFMSF